MSTSIPANHEYFEAHQHTLQAIIDGVSARISDNPHIVTEQSGPETPVYLWSTPYTAEGVNDQSSQNEALVAVARMKFIALQALATMHAVADENYKEEHLLPYTEARHEVSFGPKDGPEGIVVEISKLSGLAIYGSTAEYSVKNQDDFVTESLSIRTLSDTINNVEYNVNPTNDEQLGRWESVLEGTRFSELIPMIAGVFEDEEKLDEKLSQIWISLQGTAKEEEISTVLDDIRTRATAAKASSTLNRNFSLSLPSAQQLAEIASDVNTTT